MVDDRLQDALFCPECDGRIIKSHGHRVCKNCGLVLSEDYVPPEVDYERTSDSQERTPDSEIVDQSIDGLGSYIGHQKGQFFIDAEGNPLSGKGQKRFKKLKTVYSVRTKIGKNDAKYRALRTLNHVSKLLLINGQVRDRTAYLYKKIAADTPGKVPNNTLLIAVCLLMASREFKDQAPITLEEIANAFERCGHRVNVRAMVREALRLKSVTGYAPQIRKPEDYVPRIVSMLIHNKSVEKKAKLRGWSQADYESSLEQTILEVMEMISSTKRAGRNPYVFAAACAYAADRRIAVKAGKRAILTQKLVSQATQVAEYSIRDHYGMIKQVIELQE